MDIIAYSKEKNKHPMSFSKPKSSESDQVSYLKRLLVTLKQQFEKKMHILYEELQKERGEKETLEKFNQEVQKHHDEEVISLKEQILTLRELIAKTDLKNDSLSELAPSLTLEDFRKQEQKNSELTLLLEQEKQEYQIEIERLNEKISFFESQEDQHELISSQTSSYQLRQDLDLIKNGLIQGIKEAKNLETRYADLFNEKVMLEHELKQSKERVDILLEEQKNFKAEWADLVEAQINIKATLLAKEEALVEASQNKLQLSSTLECLEKKYQALVSLQDKYEQIKEEFQQLKTQLNEVLELRAYAEAQLKILTESFHEQCLQSESKDAHIQELLEEKEQLFQEVQGLHETFHDFENQLTLAQLHLAKKVKECTLLEEKLEEKELEMGQYLKFLEEDKAIVLSLKEELEFSQKQEKKLQDQLHESLKHSETQLAQWEEKYFEVQGKWLLNEAEIKEFKKLEEKYNQMQALVSNLGCLMGSSANSLQFSQPILTSQLKINQEEVASILASQKENDT